MRGPTCAYIGAMVGTRRGLGLLLAFAVAAIAQGCASADGASGNEVTPDFEVKGENADPNAEPPMSEEQLRERP